MSFDWTTISRRRNRLSDMPSFEVELLESMVYCHAWKPGKPVPLRPLLGLDPVEFPAESPALLPVLPSSKLRLEDWKSLMAKSSGSSSSKGAECVNERPEFDLCPVPRRISVVE